MKMRLKQYALMGAPKQHEKGVLSYADVLWLQRATRMAKNALNNGHITKEQYIHVIDKVYWDRVRRAKAKR